MEMIKIADHKRISSLGNEFVFLTQAGTIFELEAGSETRMVLDHEIASGPFTQQEFYAVLKGSDAEKESLWKDLAKNRVLAPCGMGPKQGVDHCSGMPVNTVVLHVTQACNLRCRYCYHDLEEKVPPAPASMEWPVARQAVDFLFDHSGDLEKLVLVFFGGEPLLNFRLISRTVAYADEKAKNRGKKIEYAMTTNGTLLTDKIVAFLQENRIGMTVSLDGPRADHDRFRCFPDGSPSYGAILPGIRKLLGKGATQPVVARVTLAKDIGNVPQTLAHLLGLGFSEVGFAPVTTLAADFQLDEFAMEQLLGQFRRVSEDFVRMALDDRFLGFTNLVDLLVNLHEGEVRQYPCGAGMGMFSVDPGGGLFLCQRLTHDRSARMGDIFNGFHREKLAAFRQEARLDNKGDCAGCWAASICAGGCYHEAKIRQGNLLSPNLHYCQWIKSWIETGLDVYARLSTQAPDFLDKLSMLRGHDPLPSVIGLP